MTKACVVTCAMTIVIVATMLGGCSREKIDWKSAEAADTVEGYDHFIERHPDSQLATQARARVAQLNEDRDWKRASTTDTADAYRQFLTQHESGKWAAEARIRIENFALDGTASGPARPGEPETSPAVGSTSAPTRTAAPTAVAAAKSAGSTEPKPGSFGPRADATPTATAQPAAAKPASASAAAVTPSEPASPPQFGIQLGAFHSQEAALANWKALQTKYDSDLHGLFARAVPVQQSAGQLFRLQAPVGEESRARSICASLARKSQPCVVVLPQPH